MIYWPQGQLGGARARYCAPVHSYAVKRSRNTKWKMTVDRLFTSRQDGTYRLSLFMELTQGVDVNFVIPCMLPGHVSKGPFQRYGVRRHLVNRARNDVLHKNKEKLFSICPAPYPRKSPTGPLQSTPHVVARGIVTGLPNCTVYQWQFSSIRSSFSLASSRCVHLL